MSGVEKHAVTHRVVKQLARSTYGGKDVKEVKEENEGRK
jgi:hypothetical protein